MLAPIWYNNNNNNRSVIGTKGNLIPGKIYDNDEPECQEDGCNHIHEFGKEMTIEVNLGIGLSYVTDVFSQFYSAYFKVMLP